MADKAKLTFSKAADMVVDVHSPKSKKVESLYVYSAALKNVSPVWRKALDNENGFAPLESRMEADSQTRQVLNLHDVSLAAAVIFFNIIHFNVDALPEEIAYVGLLKDITTISDEFDCRNAVKTWVKTWAKKLIENPNGPLDFWNPIPHVAWLLIASKFPELTFVHDIAKDTIWKLILRMTHVENHIIKWCDVAEPWLNTYCTHDIPEMFLGEQMDATPITNSGVNFADLPRYSQVDLPSRLHHIH